MQGHVLPQSPSGSPRWTVVVLALSAPFLVTLCVILWRTPFPVSEAVAIFEDVANRPPLNVLRPETSYYRPLFYLTLSAIWFNVTSLEAKLIWVRLLQIVPICVLVVAFIRHLRPRRYVDAAAAALAVAVLVGSPGFLDNLELPLSYTIIGMPIGLIVWMLVNREPRPWHAPTIVVLTLIAIGFKEQGLVLVPLVALARWMRAPGCTRGTCAAVMAIGIAYVAMRLLWRSSWSTFEQAVGFGFVELEPRDAVARFGTFPYWVYAYSSASTVATVLFAEPERGVFRILRAWSQGRFQFWQFIQIGTSVGLTSVMAWWGVRSIKASRRNQWSPDARIFAATCIVLLACGVLSFNYSRARLGGMAVPFYALSTFFAVRAAIEHTLDTTRMRCVATGLALMLLAAGWCTRTIATLEYARATSQRNHEEWLLQLPARRVEFAERRTYLSIMQAMIKQGTRPHTPRPTGYPPWVALTVGQP